MKSDIPEKFKDIVVEDAGMVEKSRRQMQLDFLSSRNG